MDPKWMRSKNVVWENLNGEALLVDFSTGLRWAFNASAASIWRQCDGWRTPSEIAHAFVGGANQALQGTRQEVAAFCEALAKTGLLVPCVAIPAKAAASGVVFMSGFESAPTIRSLGLGATSRRRPSPRGNSGPG